VFNCYALFGVMYEQMGVQLDFASAVARGVRPQAEPDAAWR
jgi:hypothetical protein